MWMEYHLRWKVDFFNKPNTVKAILAISSYCIKEKKQEKITKNVCLVVFRIRMELGLHSALLERHSILTDKQPSLVYRNNVCSSMSTQGTHFTPGHLAKILSLNEYFLTSLLRICIYYINNFEWVWLKNLDQMFLPLSSTCAPHIPLELFIR